MGNGRYAASHRGIIKAYTLVTKDPFVDDWRNID